MEQRSSERKPAGREVVVSCPAIGLFRGYISDIGLGGMYVQSDNVVVPMHVPVTVTFQPDGDLPMVCIDASGTVVHQSRHGFGVRFDTLDDNCRFTLSRMLDGIEESDEEAREVAMG